MAPPELPPEIWSMICGYLSWYHTFVNQDSGWRGKWYGHIFGHPDEDRMPGDRPLLNLCLVSKRMRTVVTPHLYTFFDWRCDKALLFIRSIVEKPHLATYVRGLRIEPFVEALGEKSSEKATERDPESFRVLFALCDMIHQASTSSREHIPNASEFLEKSSQYQSEIIAQWLMLNLPNLELLKLSLIRGWSFNYLNLVAKSGVVLLPRLDTLEVFSVNDMSPFDFTLSYEESLLAADEASRMRLARIQSLFGLPMLKTFVIDSCMELGNWELSSTGISRLIHEDCRDDKCQFEKLIATSPNLERIDLKINRYNNINPDLSLLSFCKNSLHHLQLTIAFLLPISLAHLKSLKELIITANAIDPRSNPHRDRLNTWQKGLTRLNFLAEMLPRSIERIRLDSDGMQFNVLVPWETPAYHLLHYHLHKFPRLRLVELPAEPGEPREETFSHVQLKIGKKHDGFYRCIHTTWNDAIKLEKDPSCFSWFG